MEIRKDEGSTRNYISADYDEYARLQTELMKLQDEISYLDMAYPLLNLMAVMLRKLQDVDYGTISQTLDDMP